jgi:hypothetical protein
MFEWCLWGYDGLLEGRVEDVTDASNCPGDKESEQRASNELVRWLKSEAEAK